MEKIQEGPSCLAPYKRAGYQVCVPKQELFLYKVGESCETEFMISMVSCEERYVESSSDATGQVRGSARVGSRGAPVLQSYRGSSVLYDGLSTNQTRMSMNQTKMKGTNDERVESCKRSCEEVDSHICFEASTTKGHDRVFEMRYQVNDETSSILETFTVDAFIRETSSPNGAPCREDYLYSKCGKRRRIRG